MPADARQARRNRAAGSRWEIDIVNGLRSLGFEVDRLHLNGKEDEGDVVVREDGIYTVIEAKSGALHPSDFIRQADLEAKNFAKHRGLDMDDVEGIVICKTRGKPWHEAVILMSMDTYFNIKHDKDI